MYGYRNFQNDIAILEISITIESCDTFQSSEVQRLCTSLDWYTLYE